MSDYLGFILQPTYRLRSGRPVIQLFGRLEQGEAFVVEDDRFRPYFFVPREVVNRVSHERHASIDRTQLRDLRGREVVRVTADVPGDVPGLRTRLEQEGGEALEADIRFAYRYLIDHGLRASLRIEGEAKRISPRLLHFRNPELHPAVWRPELSLLSIDIETDPTASRVYSAALCSREVDEIHVVADAELPHARCYPDEPALLAGLAERIRELDPDVITGWNVVDFDLRVLDRRAELLQVRFDLGRVDGSLRIQTDRGFTRQARADLPGRQVLDGVALVRDAIPLEDYTLETAANALLGRGKLIDKSGRARAEEITRLYENDLAAFAEYNREDARLVLDILEQESLVELAVERSLLSGMQLDRVGASIASFDLVYLPELRRRGFVAPSVDVDRKHGHVLGGAVLDSSPGFYRNVAVFDFRSLYPSLIRTFNLDPLAHARAADESDAITAPNGARFSRREAILPDVLDLYFARRDEAKRRQDRHADLAIKIMMNALFGVLGAASCRFFDPEVANAITHFGQRILTWTRDAFQAEGRDVLYGDTDSVFVALDPDSGVEAARATASELRDRVQERISGRIRAEHAVEPRLELEIERIYTRFFQPRVRGGSQGSKKRYAGLDGETLRLVGLEAVRRDSTPIARRLQEGMLQRAFRDSPVEPFVKELIERLLSGELDRELVIRKGLRKGALERYTATTPPHIKAARKAAERTGEVERVVSYVITERGPEPVLRGEPLPRDIDRRHYLEKVVRPVADAVLEHLGSSTDDLLGIGRQLSLL
jgi:DNA polymerase-2